jgi:hypothetical protein
MTQRSWRGRQVVGVVAVVGLALAGPMGAGEARAQEAQAQQPPALTLDSGAGLLFHQIKADRTADFEWVIGRIKDALLKSEDPTHKQQAAGIQVLRSTDPGQNGNVMYVIFVNPAVKGADYSMQALLKLLYAAFPEQQQEIYQKVSGAFGGPTNRLNLQPLADFSK